MPPVAEYKIDIDGGESIDTFSAYVPSALPSCLVRALEERQREEEEQNLTAASASASASLGIVGFGFDFNFGCIHV